MSGKELAVAGNNAREKEFKADQQKPLDTPRTREACRRLGLVPEDLQIRSFESFYIPGDLKEKHQLRFEHYEKKRKERFSQVLAERAKVIAENAKKGDLPGGQSAQFLSMLESLFEKEAKRMEIDMKGQLRQHSSLVKENEEQLQKEGRQQEKMLKVDEARDKVTKQLEEKAKVSREVLDKRLVQNKEAVTKLEKDHQEKQANYAKEMLAEEERLQSFLEERKLLNLEKTSQFRDRVKDMKEKTELLQEERRIDGERQLQRIEERIQKVSKRREDEQKQRQLRSEEQHLHLMDVREAKNRIDRVDGYRRQELREQIDGNIERIETLLALKDQLLDQRKGRNTKVESTRGSRGLALRDLQPGPGTYEAPPTCLHELPAARIGKSKVPGLVDVAIQGTKHNPAPGSYDTPLLPNGDKLNQPSGGEFNKRDRDSFLDEVTRVKNDIPAPGRYPQKTVLEKCAVRMSRERIVEEHLDKYSAKRYPVWARPPADTPGPASYSVDDYTRKEVLRRAQRSLPNLTRDMLRPGKPAA
ncbi:unnamed protein product [Effrenium voratum]|uniref:Uncharacterized protein n=1 Tax=Effrenium voratum TaxID=2562239 RepID=A0AA36JS22_9DINO|nr:unnamed protein product [Effrenium voratum]CAJ1443674.1 unnamed protein product [Effrenium voratum]